MTRYLVLAPCQSSNISDVMWGQGAEVDIFDDAYAMQLQLDGKLARVDESDLLPITISNISVSAFGNKGFDIAWTTDIACHGQLQWGKTIDYGNFYSDDAVDTGHDVGIAVSQKRTTYHFRIIAATDGARGISDDQTFDTGV